MRCIRPLLAFGMFRRTDICALRSCRGLWAGLRPGWRMLRACSPGFEGLASVQLLSDCNHRRCRGRRGECLDLVRVHEAGHYVIAKAEGFTNLSVSASVCTFSHPADVDPLSLVRVAVAGRVAEALLVDAAPGPYWRELVEYWPRTDGLCVACSARRAFDSDCLLCDVCGAARDSRIDLDDPAFAEIVEQQTLPTRSSTPGQPSRMRNSTSFALSTILAGSSRTPVTILTANTARQSVRRAACPAR